MQSILHIGLHKTGSSAIQAALSGYDDGGTIYAQLGHRNHSAALVSAVSPRYRDYHVWKKSGLTGAEIDARREAARDAVNAALGRDDRTRVIFSAEDVSTLRAPDLRALVDWLAGAGPVTILVYLRDPADYAVSALQQMIQGGARDLPRRISPRYRAVLSAAADTGARLIVRDFRPGAFPDGDVVSDLCDVLDLDRARCGSERPNTRLSGTALRLLWQFNRSNPAFHGDAQLLRAHERLKHILRASFAADAPIPAKPFAALADGDDLDWLRDTHGIDYPPPETGADAGAAARWLDAPVPDACPALRAVLERHGIRAPEGADTTWLLNRLFYLCLAEDRFDPDTMTLRSPRLTEDDLPDLRSAALSHAGPRPLTRGEARHLLDLALRIRPKGPLLQRTRAEWDSDDNA